MKTAFDPKSILRAAFGRAVIFFIFKKINEFGDFLKFEPPRPRNFKNFQK